MVGVEEEGDGVGVFAVGIIGTYRSKLGENPQFAIIDVVDGGTVKGDGSLGVFAVVLGLVEIGLIVEMDPIDFGQVKFFVIAFDEGLELAVFDADDGDVVGVFEAVDIELIAGEGGSCDEGGEGEDGGAEKSGRKTHG